MVTDFPAPPQGQHWHFSANHSNRELVVQLVNTFSSPLTGLPLNQTVAERRIHLHWDTDQIRHAVVDAMNYILHTNGVNSKLDTFLKELEAEANNH